jgi:patatin-like phospholipase/acyl hydrolase
MSVHNSNDASHYRYRILSLDGGGIKGAYTASVLHTLETHSGKSIGEHFDLITGTSTGGIIAIAIGLGISLGEIVDLYVKKGPVIFPTPRPGLFGKLSEMCRHGIKPKHSQEILAKEIREKFGERTFGESRNRLVIPAFDALNGDIHLFKTAHCKAYRMDYQLAAKDVALATSAAPTFFTAFAEPNGRVFVDGGVWANCPVMVGLVEATAALGWPLEKIDVLSVGTTSEPFDVSRGRRNGGILHWNKGLITVFQEAQTRGMIGLASAMTRHRLMRIDAMTRSGRFSLDDATEVLDLKGLGENSARKCLNEVCVRFLSQRTASFTPYNISR